MQPERTRQLCIGYVLKRFPRVSETFIAQEILELEQRGVDVRVFTLQANDAPAPHGWLRDLRAEITHCGSDSFSASWDWLQRRVHEGGLRGQGALRALALAARCPVGRGRRYLSEAVSVARQAERSQVDHLHAHFANRPALVSLLAHAITGLPFSFTAHAKDIYACGPPAALWPELAGSAAFVSTVTQANHSYLKGLVCGARRSRLEVLYNGVDLDTLRPRPAARSAEVPHLVCVARMVEKKGLDLLLEALAWLRDRGVPFRCTIVGDGPEAERLLRQREQLGLDPRVAFPGALAHEDVVRELLSGDVFVLPCRVARDGDRDALPTVLLEAMACGLPCVSTPVGGIAEIVRDPETGRLVPADSARELADAIRDLLGDAGLRERMGAAARRRAEQLFDRRHNVARLHRWFSESSRGAGSHELQLAPARREA